MVPLRSFLLDRREFLSATGCFAAPGVLFEPDARRRPAHLVFVKLRGGLDALSAVPPFGDPNYIHLRGDEFDRDRSIRLSGSDFFAIHQNLPFIATLIGRRQSYVVHACGTCCKSLSHFDAYQCLENGSIGDNSASRGWVSRLAQTEGLDHLRVSLPQDEPRHPPSDRPSDLPLTGSTGHSFGSSARRIGRYLATSEHPHAVSVDFPGWDTHSHQESRLAIRLSHLDAFVQGLVNSLGTSWSSTAIIMASEFGRTLQMNANGGTDHGHGTMMIVAGGSIEGGRVVADWPGLLNARDAFLPATTDAVHVIRQVVKTHFGMTPRALNVVFPSVQS